jgi:hypothetical protein
MSAGSGLFTNQRAQRPHLVRGGGGLAGEVADLRADVSDEMEAQAAIAVEEWTDVALADVDAIKASIASSASAESYSGADLDGAVGAGTMDPPRNITITTSAHADIDAVAVTITGKDVNGDDITEDITLTDGGGVTNAGAKAFAEVTQIDVPAQSGTGGALEFGFGAILGLARPLKERAGLVAVLKQIEAGADVGPTAGDFVAAPSAAGAGQPNGTFEPTTPPDGSNDYAVFYEWDASVKLTGRF